jgi:hypothetical protein
MKPLIILTVLLATPSAAAEIDLSDFAATASTAALVEPRIPDYVSNAVDLADVRVLVGESGFDAAVEELDANSGERATTGDGRLAFCIEGAGTRVWIVSGEPVDEAIEAVGAVVVEPATATVAGCHLRADLDVQLGPDIPGIGARAADLAARFGGTAADGVVSYQHRTMRGDEGDNWLLITTITYEVRAGIVAAVGLSRRTAESPKGLSRFGYWSPVIIAEQIDVRSFPSSLGPRLEEGLATFADYGFTEVDRVDDAAVLYEEDGSWMFGITVLEATDERLVLCILDKAMNGGTYRSQDAVAFKDGEDGLLVATGEAVQNAACPILR